MHLICTQWFAFQKASSSRTPTSQLTFCSLNAAVQQRVFGFMNIRSRHTALTLKAKATQLQMEFSLRSSRLCWDGGLTVEQLNTRGQLMPTRCEKMGLILLK